MRCVCCNSILTDYEATMRNANTLEFLDMCGSCHSSVKEYLPTINRADLQHTETEDNEEDLA